MPSSGPVSSTGAMGRIPITLRQSTLKGMWIILKNSLCFTYILEIKTNYCQSEDFKRIEKKMKKDSINPTIGFDFKDMK